MIINNAFGLKRALRQSINPDVIPINKTNRNGDNNAHINNISNIIAM